MPPLIPTRRSCGLVARIMQAAFDPRCGEAWTRSQCAGVMAMPGVALTIAELDGRVAGFAIARTIMDEAELLLLAVDPARRRRGIGRALLRSGIADGESRGIAQKIGRASGRERECEYV